jgi:hypothetical protein
LSVEEKRGEGEERLSDVSCMLGEAEWEEVKMRDMSIGCSESKGFSF